MSTPKPTRELTPEWIRKKRLHLKLSQSEFAARIGTCRSTVNRWEMGHFSPHPVFQRMLRELPER